MKISYLIFVSLLSLIYTQEEKSEKQMKVSACMRLGKARISQDKVTNYIL